MIPIDSHHNLSQDDSLNYYSELSSPKTSDLEAPLISLTTDVKELLEEFVVECKDINDFYITEKKRITEEYNLFYTRFLGKISTDPTHMNLQEDLKQYNLDGLGYSSSWSRKFVEFYSKLSWLDGFAKINIVAIQKILLKFDKILFTVKESKFNHKLNLFIYSLPLTEEKGCIQERKKIMISVSKHYFNHKENKAFKFLESTLSAHKPKGRGTLKLLLGIMIGLTLILIFFICSPAREGYYPLDKIKEIYPIYRGTLSFIFTLL